MNSKLLFSQIKMQLPRMEGVAIKVEDDKLNFYVDGRKEFYVRQSGGVSFEPDCSYSDKVKKTSDAAIHSVRYVRDYISAICKVFIFNGKGKGR